MDERRAFIGGRRIGSKGTMADLDPSTGEVLAEVSRCGVDEVEAAVENARDAFFRTWRYVSPRERATALRRMADAIRQRGTMLAEEESQDTGKPLSQARRDVENAARYFEYYGGILEAFSGEVIPTSRDVLAYCLKEPYGVTAHIIPWNFPLQTAARTLAPALAAGNCCVLKPAEEAPITPLRLGDVAEAADLPPGVLNVVPGYGEEAGAPLAAHPGVDHLAFTGSREVGRSVAKAAADNTVPVILELGGKSPNVVLGDADLVQTVPIIVDSILQNAGQVCSAGSRLLVERSVQSKIVNAVHEMFGAARLGPGLQDPDVGPLISEEQRRRVGMYVEIGKSEATLKIGGDAPSDEHLERGFFFLPTLFDDVPSESVIAREEIFGPVLAVTPFDSAEEGAHLANQTDYGLVAAIWTRDIDKAHWLAREIQAGQVFVNTFGAGGGQDLPFGGYKGSGYGREKGIEALRSYTQTKTVVVKAHDLEDHQG